MATGAMSEAVIIKKNKIPRLVTYLSLEPCWPRKQAVGTEGGSTGGRWCLDPLALVVPSSSLSVGGDVASFGDVAGGSDDMVPASHSLLVRNN